MTSENRAALDYVNIVNNSLKREEFILKQIKMLQCSAAFDGNWYLFDNPDVKLAEIDPAEHYVRWGALEQRQPAKNFDAIWYLEKYDDVRASDLLPFVHFATKGVLEGRSSSKYSDLSQRATWRFHQGQSAEPPIVLHQGSRQFTARIAAILHIFYPDTWNEIRTAIDNIAEPVDLFVSLTTGHSDYLCDTILLTYPKAYIYCCRENRGRDILPLMHLINSGLVFKYDLICKIHSKRSKYVPDGDAWRRALIGGILGNGVITERIIRNFRENPNIGVVVAEENIYKGNKYWIGNEYFVDALLKRADMTINYNESSFPGGSIFWIRPLILAVLRGINIQLDDFELEPLPDNGTLAHAVERMIGCICENIDLDVMTPKDLFP